MQKREHLASVFQGVGYMAVFFGTLGAPFGVLVILLALLSALVGLWSLNSVKILGCGAIPIALILTGVAIARVGDHLSDGRAARGLCPQCGYDLRGGRIANAECRTPSSSGCPECGWGRGA